MPKANGSAKSKIIAPDKPFIHAKAGLEALTDRQRRAVAITSALARFNINRNQSENTEQKKNIFVPAKPWPGVVPNTQLAKDEMLAMDDAFTPLSAYAFNQYGSSMEGQGFLGYAALAELSQRAEFRKFAEILSEEMCRKFVKLVSASDDNQNHRIRLLNDAFEKFKIKEVFRKIAECDCLYGRCNLYPDFGPQEPAVLRMPLALNNVSIPLHSLRGFKVVEPIWTYPARFEAMDPTADTFYKPRHWYVMGKEYHYTRMMPFVGRAVPDILKPAYAFGGQSVTQLVKPYVDNFIRVRQNVSDLIETFAQQVLLTDLDLTMLDESGQQLDERVQLYNSIKSTRGLMVLDKNAEDFKTVATPLSGLHELQAQAQEMMCSGGVSVPLVKYLGIQPSGLNASSEGEIRVFFDHIGASQGRLFDQHILFVLQIIMLSELGEVNRDISYAYEPLWQMSELDTANIRKTEADTASVYIKDGVLDPQEERERLANEEDGTYNGIDPDKMPEPPPQTTPGVDPVTGEPIKPEDDAGEGMTSGMQQNAPGSSAPKTDTVGHASRPPTMAKDVEFKENEHPRSEDGKFGSGGGGGNTKRNNGGNKSQFTQHLSSAAHEYEKDIFSEAQKQLAAGKSVFFSTSRQTTEITPKAKELLRFNNGKIQFQEGRKWISLNAGGQALDTLAARLGFPTAYDRLTHQVENTDYDAEDQKLKTAKKTLGPLLDRHAEAQEKDRAAGYTVESETAVNEARNELKKEAKKIGIGAFDLDDMIMQHEYPPKTAKDKEFKEDEHPRSEDGKFGSGGGGAATKAKAPAPKPGQPATPGKATAPKTPAAAPAAQPAPTPASAAPKPGFAQAQRTPDGKGFANLPPHIANIKIPPAWTNVTYAEHADAPLLVQGRDVKGRVQSIYSPAVTAANAAQKFERIKKLDTHFKALKQANEAARKSANPRVKDAAEALALIMSTGIRPGSEDNTKAAEEALGATTLRGENVKVDAKGNVTLKFTGKKGVKLNIPVADPDIASMVKQRAQNAGPGNKLFPMTNNKALNAHISTGLGAGFEDYSSKDFRTLHGTKTAIQFIAGMKPPTNDTEWKKAVGAVAKHVSEKLGNTPAIALASYISPTVFSVWGNKPE